MADGVLEIHRSHWQNEDLTLICGIANAGGGQLIVGGAERTRARNVRRMYKVFETIPQLTQETLGFACPAEPIMDGPRLCLEIAVPAATEPILFDGKYYLYTQQGNLCLEGSELEEFLETRAEQAKALAKDDGSLGEALDAASSVASSIASSTASEEKASSASALQASVTDEASDDDESPATGHHANRQQNASASASSHSAKPSKATASSFKTRSVAAAKDLYLTNTDEYVLKVLNANGRATAPKIASLLGISESTVRRSFRRLKEYGMIERIGSDKAGYWKVNL